MLEAKLTTCASLLYLWILPRTSPETKLKVDLQDFQAWTSEYREKPYSDREILDAFRQLKELQLIRVSKTEVTLEASPVEDFSLNPQLSDHLFLGDSETFPQNTPCDRPNRFMTFLRISVGSLALGLVSVGFGLALMQLQPEVLTMPHPWSVLGEKNTDSGN